MRYWVGAGAAFGLGGLIGFLAGAAAVQKAAKKEYEERLATYKFITEIDPQSISLDLKPNAFGGIVELIDNTDSGEIIITPQTQAPDAQEVWVDSPEKTTNDYHKAINAIETPIDTFVDGGINDYSISYIEEEEFLEDDGRNKNQITIIMDEHNPIFLMNGEQIHDWDERVGDSILVDFYKLVPPGLEPVLYVRNHRTDEDYEVVREMP